MNRKWYVILTIVLILPALRGETRGDDLTSRFRSHVAGAHVAAAEVVGERPAALLAIPGIARPSKQVTMASPMEGMLMAMHVVEGQRVKANDVLATIDNHVAQAAVELARAAADRSATLQHAREELKLNESILKRLHELRSANGGSEFELLEACTRVEQSRANVAGEQERQRQSKCQLELELARLESHNIRAPFDGQVVRIYAHPGTTLTRDDDMLTLIRLEELEVDLHISLAYYDQLDVGRSYALIAGPPISTRIEGQLAFVAPTIDSATRTFRTVFTIHNNERKLPAGFAVQLDTQALRRVEALENVSAVTRK